MSAIRYPRLGAISRWAGAGAALVTSAGLFVAVAGAFFQLASQPWLHPGPEVLRLAEQCRALPGRADQDACMRQLVAQRSRPPLQRLAAASVPLAADVRPRAAQP